MESITFTASPQAELCQSHRRLHTLACAGFAVLMIISLGLAVWWFGFSGAERLLPAGEGGTVLFWLAIGLLVAAAPISLSIPHPTWPRRAFIACDEEGLTYAYGRYRNEWPWRDIDSFEIETPAFRHPHGKLTVSGSPGWKARLHALLAGADVTSWWITFYVMDAYDRPLEEIAATLNAYRERAAATAG